MENNQMMKQMFEMMMEMKSDMTEMKKDMSEVKSEIKDMKSEIKSLREDVDLLKDKTDNIQKSMTLGFNTLLEVVDSNYNLNKAQIQSLSRRVLDVESEVIEIKAILNSRKI